MCLRKGYFFLFILLVISSAAMGQAANTPFSTFGIGEPFGDALIQNQGMGGIGVSQPQIFSINNQNPALLVYNYYTTFQGGALFESRSLTGDTASQKSSGGNMNYLVISFPVKVNKWTTSAGLMPFTHVNYKISYFENIANSTNQTSVLEQGDGGLTQFYWSNGVRINKSFTVGLKAAYLFGSINRDYANLASLNYDGPNPPRPFIAAVNEQTYVKDFMFTGGLSFSKDSIINNKLRLSAGLVYSFGTKLKTEKTTLAEIRLPPNQPVNIPDTIITRGGSITIPSSLTLGVSLSKGNRWMVGAEFSTQNWSEFRNLNGENEKFEQAWRVSLGGEITPDASSNNYLKRVIYRAGMSYEKNPFVVESPVNSGKYNSAKDIGINFGLSLPTGMSSLDLGARIGKRGDKADTVFEETYYKIYFGITFNDRWFIKRRLD
jgi:hypothetical protein